MKQIYQAADLIEAQLLKDFLGGVGIEVVIQGEFLPGAAGELPLNAYPSLWVVEDEEAERGRLLIRQWLAGNGAEGLYQGSWICPHCGEKLGAQFSQCWNCGRHRP